MNNSNVISKDAKVNECLKLGNFNVIGSVNIGKNVEIGNNCTIEDNCTIGNGTKIKCGVEIRSGTIIGENCYIDSGVISSGNNVIGDNVTLRFNSIIARGCNIGDDSYICPQVMTNNVDHEQNPIGGATVGKDCFIGTQTVLAAGISIIDKTTVGSCSMVTKSIKEPGIYIGVPAKLVKK